MPHWLVIGISGITCGGKTTLANSLRDYFQNQRNAPLWHTAYTVGDVQLISQDDYFLPVDDLRHKWNVKLNAINYELITSLDMKQMLSDITWTMKGRYLAEDPLHNIDYVNKIAMSTGFEHYAPPTTTTTHQYPNQHYNHPLNLTAQQHRHLNSSAAQIMRINAQVVASQLNILIIEGFMIFNQPELLKICNLKFHFHLPYEKCFSRRKQRKYDPPDVVGYFEVCVWPHYEKNFADFRGAERKDLTILNGEICKDRIFKFVLQKIVAFFEVVPPPQKLMGIPTNAGCVMEQ